MQHYSLGFIFNANRSKVLLVHKLNPEWQRGKLNGIGGKCEPGEDALSCMVRETFEESALEISAKQWTRLGVMTGLNWSTEVFACTYDGDESDARKNDKEEVEWFWINELPANVISNLRWLIPLALDKLEYQQPSGFEIQYQ